MQLFGDSLGTTPYPQSTWDGEHMAGLTSKQSNFLSQAMLLSWVVLFLPVSNGSCCLNNKFLLGKTGG